MIPKSRENQQLSCDYAGRAVKRVRISIIALAFILGIALTATTQAQTYKVIYTFTGGADGAYPETGLTMDGSGNIYGTAFSGGAHNYGAIFSLDDNKGSWLLTTMYSFEEGSDGAGPIGALVVGPDGVLYGSTSAGGAGPAPVTADIEVAAPCTRLVDPPANQPTLGLRTSCFASRKRMDLIRKARSPSIAPEIFMARPSAAATPGGG